MIVPEQKDFQFGAVLLHVLLGNVSRSRKVKKCGFGAQVCLNGNPVRSHRSLDITRNGFFSNGRFSSA